MFRTVMFFSDLVLAVANPPWLSICLGGVGEWGMGVFLSTVFTLVCMGLLYLMVTISDGRTLSSQRSWKDDVCEYCESELFQDVPLGIFLAFVVLYSLLVWLGHSFTSVVPWAFSKWQQQCWWFRREGLCWAEHGAGWRHSHPIYVVWCCLNSFFITIPISKSHASNFHLLSS